jgi:hypothetical protein
MATLSCSRGSEPNPPLATQIHVTSCRPLPPCISQLRLPLNSPPASSPPTFPLSQVDADVQPTYVRITAKKQTLQLVLPSEVLTDASSAKRSATTGHLLLTCPKLCPIVTSQAPKPRKKVASLAAPSAALLQPPPIPPGTELRGAVDIC